MNARTVLPLILLSLAAVACGNKGPLVQAPVEVPIEPPVEAPPAETVPVPAPADADADSDADVDSEDATPESGEADDDEGPAAG